MDLLTAKGMFVDKIILGLFLTQMHKQRTRFPAGESNFDFSPSARLIFRI